MLNAPSLLCDGSISCVDNCKNHLKFSLKAREQKLNLICPFFSSPTAQKQQPASSSSLMRGKLWTQGTDMAASKETDANIAAIAGPGGELAFVFSHMPSSNPSKSSGGFSELKENKCLWRDEKVEKRMGFKHVRLLISWVLWLKFVLVASVDDKAFLTGKPTHLQGLILNKKPKLISIFRCRKSKHSYRGRKYKWCKEFHAVSFRCKSLLHMQRRTVFRLFIQSWRNQSRQSWFFLSFSFFWKETFLINLTPSKPLQLHSREAGSDM